MPNRMSQQVRHSPDGTRWEDASHDVRHVDDDAEFNDIFADCLQVYFAVGKSAKEVAWELGLSESHLSEMRAGKRSVTGPRLLRMFKRNPFAWLTFGQRVAATTGTEPPRRKRELKRADVKRQLELEMKKAPQVVDLFLEKVARAFGADLEEVKDAWSETTDVKEVE